jgi:hypothetical protein
MLQRDAESLPLLPIGDLPFTSTICRNPLGIGHMAGFPGPGSAVSYHVYADTKRKRQMPIGQRRGRIR